MSRRVRIGILIALVGIVLAGAGVFALNSILRQTLAPPPAPTPIAPLTADVIVTSRAVPMGMVLRSDDLRLQEVPVEAAPPGAVTNLEAAIGRFTKIDLVAGEMLLDHHLADPTNVNHDVAYLIEDNQVLMAFPATDLMSTVNVLQRGDIVDIFATISQEVPVEPDDPEGFVQEEEERETKSYDITFDAMQRVQISAMVVEVIDQEQQSNRSVLPEGDQADQPAPTPVPANYRVRAYLLALNPQDALVLKHLKDTGAVFDLVLRAPTSNEFFNLFPVNPDYLIDRYQLEATE